MRRDTLLGTVHGILAAQLIKPQARVLARDRGIDCVTVDYDLLRGLESTDDRLFCVHVSLLGVWFSRFERRSRAADGRRNDERSAIRTC